MIRFFTLLALSAALTSFGQADWQQKLNDRLPLFGHRNWIVIADSAYPLQTAPGIETVYTGDDQLTVLKTVLAALDRTRHVRANVMVDAELEYVAEKNAPGIKAYRQKLRAVLGAQTVTPLPHEQIIAKLDEAGRTFGVLLFKTKLTLPYTSVYLQLDCGYWDAQSEAELRTAIKAEH